MSKRLRAELGNRLAKFLRIIGSSDRNERFLSLVENRFNGLLNAARIDVSSISSFAEYLSGISRSRPDLYQFAKPQGEADKALHDVQNRFLSVASKYANLPFPASFNADSSFAVLTYAMVRALKPCTVIETGVGYGITSALILDAIEKNGRGNLISIDLPSLSDVNGRFIGIAVPDEHKRRWNLLRGTSRRLLPKALASIQHLDLFISDSANVFTLQRFEFRVVMPALSPTGVAVFNNVHSRFQRYVTSHVDMQVEFVRQVEKPRCVTALVTKL